MREQTHAACRGHDGGSGAERPLALCRPPLGAGSSLAVTGAIQGGGQAGCEQAVRAAPPHPGFCLGEGQGGGGKETPPPYQASKAEVRSCALREMSTFGYAQDSAKPLRTRRAQKQHVRLIFYFLEGPDLPTALPAVLAHWGCPRIWAELDLQRIAFQGSHFSSAGKGRASHVEDRATDPAGTSRAAHVSPVCVGVQK